jgi:hypothetical protein
MILAPHGRILAETWKADDDMVVADLDASLLEVSQHRQALDCDAPARVVRAAYRSDRLGTGHMHRAI